MEVVSAFAALGTSEKLEADTERAIYNLFASFMSLVALWWMLVISDGSCSPRSNLQAEKLAPTRGASHEAIARGTLSGHGVMSGFLTLTYHQQQPTGGRKRID